jgi:hypothetical protein
LIGQGCPPRRLGQTSQHAPGDDVYGYEDAGERWLPVHSVESVVSMTQCGVTFSDAILPRTHIVFLP